MHLHDVTFNLRDKEGDWERETERERERDNETGKERGEQILRITTCTVRCKDTISSDPFLPGNKTLILFAIPISIFIYTGVGDLKAKFCKHYQIDDSVQSAPMATSKLCLLREFLYSEIRNYTMHLHFRKVFVLGL